MNVIHASADQATAAISGWLARSEMRVQLKDGSKGAHVWDVTRVADDGMLTIQTYEHLDAIGLSYTLALLPASRLKKLELAAHLNESIAFAKFAIDRLGDLQVEYMLSCAEDYLPAVLEEMVNRVLDLRETLPGTLKVWDLDLADEDAGLPRVEPQLLC